MSVDASKNADSKGKSRKLSNIMLLFLVSVGAGVGFFSVQKGVLEAIRFSDDHIEEQEQGMVAVPVDTSEIVFIEIDPIMISLASSGDIRYLRFRAQLEVDEEYKSDVTKLLPRIVDVLNGYLRALEVQDFQSPTALIRLRGQMLHRVQIVVGRNRVRDLLIMDFILN